MDNELNVFLIIMFLIAGTFNVVFPLILGWWIIKLVAPMRATQNDIPFCKVVVSNKHQGSSKFF